MESAGGSGGRGDGDAKFVGGGKIFLVVVFSVVVEIGGGGEGVRSDGSCEGFGVFVAVIVTFGLVVGFDIMNDGADEGDEEGHCLLADCLDGGVWDGGKEEDALL